MDLLVIGAGPYGLAVGARARYRGLSCTVVGRPMQFWAQRMPPGMLLRSGRDWHMDPQEEATLESWGRAELPIGVEAFLEYARWFLERSGVEPIDETVTEL